MPRPGIPPRCAAGRPRCHPNFIASAIAALLAAIAFFGADTTLARDIERILVNQPPETMITAGPADSNATNYLAHFFWVGADADGVVDHFDIILVDHPSSNDSIVGGNDPVIITVPAPDDPRWTSTAANESLFVTLADTLRRDPRPGPGETPDDVLQVSFDRWHTLFVRAVDDAGDPDPTPAYRSFDAQTLAPTIRLLPPVLPGAIFLAPPTVVFNWDGEDPVGDGTTIEPVASRWVLIRSGIDLSRPGNIYTSYPDSLYSLPQRYQWSNWQSWNDPNGRQAVISNLRRVGEASGSGYYIFAVQAIDEAGAITPVFDYATPGKNNVALLRVQGDIGPILMVRDAVVGTFTFGGTSNPIVLDIAAGQTLAFRWSADASHYGGTVTAYRYGWDIANPDNDQEWFPWSPTTLSAPPRSFTTGTHRLYVQTRDNAEQIVQAIVELRVHPMTLARDLLWVDDTDHLTDTLGESDEDARWTSVLRHMTEISDLGFDENQDVYDVREHQDQPPDVATIFDYKTIIWSTRSGVGGSSGLRHIAQFFDPFTQRYRNTAKPFTVLNVYLANGGRLWINGFRPAKQLWPDERAAGAHTEPVNVTNWDDPVDPHPGVDSVGTSSLLYRMGIEMFDVGAASGFPRFQSQHFCYGLRPVASGAPELAVGPTWGQGGTGGRSNIEIFDMVPALASQLPPLVPPAGKTRVLYAYVSQLLEDPEQGILYPQTADNQPMLLASKTSLDDAHESMAFCGFEPYLLAANAHEALTRTVLFDAMGLGPTPVLLQHFAATLTAGVVHISWQTDATSDPAEFDLRATSGAMQWLVPFTPAGARAFQAVDESSHLAQASGSVTYSLFAREPGQAWTLLGQETITLAAAPPPRLQLLAPQPNPFNPRTKLEFVLPAQQRVRLDICTVDGRVVTTLVDAVRPAGTTSLDWDGSDAAGRQAPSGLYLVRLESAGVRLARKLVLMK